MTIQIHWWVLFNLFVLAMLALDLGVFHRKAHVVSLKEAIGWSILWVVVALLFNVGLYFMWPAEVGGLRPGPAAMAFFTGYVIERALSIDNIFVFVVLFAYFQVPATYHHRVLFWGILGAMILRAVFIAAGVTLIHKFHWTMWIFGIFLVFTGIKMAFAKGVEVHPERNPVLKLMRRILPVSPGYVEGHFLTRIDGRLLVTPLFIVLMMVETTDLVFAIDSIPAILAITENSFIVYSSNVFAILGLRALYFALAGVMDLFQFLHFGLSAVLVFIGVKMLLDVGWDYKISIGVSLGTVGAILTLAVVVSILFRPRRGPDAP